MREAIVSTVVLLAAAVSAQQAGLSVGDPAPELSISRWLDGEPAFEPGNGEAAMLVFWAQWCGPCVAEFPHLNDLVDAVAGLPVTIVSITDDPADKVEALLGKRPLRSRVAFDDDGKTFDAYGVRVLPRVVLVDLAGEIAALPAADAVDADVLRCLAAGEPIDLPQAQMLPADLEWDERGASLDPEASLAHAVIARSMAASGGMRFPEPGRITADGVSFGVLLQIAFEASHDEIVVEEARFADPDDRYRISVKAPDEQRQTARDMLREQLERTFDFAAEWTQVEERTPVLRQLAGTEAAVLTRSTEEKASGGARSGQIDFKKVTMGRIAQAIGGLALGKTMLDETGLEGEFDITLEWIPGDRESLTSALAECGLEFSSQPRTVRKLRVEPR